VSDPKLEEMARAFWHEWAEHYASDNPLYDSYPDIAEDSAAKYNREAVEGLTILLTQVRDIEHARADTRLREVEARLVELAGQYRVATNDAEVTIREWKAKVREVEADFAAFKTTALELDNDRIQKLAEVRALREALVECHGTEPSVNFRDGKAYEYCPLCDDQTWPCKVTRLLTDLAALAGGER